MGKFSKYRIHFDVESKYGKLAAHSDFIPPDQVEEYCRVFGCGHRSVYSASGDTTWQADIRGEDQNSRRLLLEWLDEMENIYPRKAAVLRGMLDEDN